MIEETLLEAEEKMEKAVVVAKEDFAAIRTGRAHPAMFNKIVADYYGAITPINQLASFSVPEPRMAVVTPFDKSALRNIEQAIRDSDLGVNPSNDGNIIRVVFPELTEERRKEYIKVAKNKGEDAKISIRSIRRKAKETLDKLVKDGEAGEDEVRRAEKELDDTTREVRRAGGRAAQAQGSRAARGLMNDSSWGAPPGAGHWGPPDQDRPSLRRRVPAGPVYDWGDAAQTRPMPIDARRQAETRTTTAIGVPPGSVATLLRAARRDEPRSPPSTRSGPSSPEPPTKKSAGRNLRAAIGVGVGLGVVIVASLFVFKPVFVGVIAIAVVVGLWELTSRLAERKDIRVAAGAARGRRRRDGGRRLRPRCRGRVDRDGAHRARRPRLADDRAARELSAGRHRRCLRRVLRAVPRHVRGADARRRGDGPQRVLTFLLLTVVSDTGAYAVGWRFGTHKLAPRISPGKTREGLVGAVPSRWWPARCACSS